MATAHRNRCSGVEDRWYKSITVEDQDGRKSSKRVPSHVQVELLARSVAENPTVIRFLAYTGLRWGEMAALKVSSSDMLCEFVRSDVATCQAIRTDQLVGVFR
ncbi:hypothetical protein [Nocardia sp. NPDC051570]|uniref:hypothetical protein n=1 Tax=Nocardia sp. NPDC051570 TaxID=3364324 RepID=UPI0037AC1A50